MPASTPRYSLLSDVISKGFDARRRAGSPLTVRQAAKELGISTATFAAWKGGYRAPSPKHIPALSQLLYPHSRDEQANFAQELMRAVDPSSVATQSILDREVRIGVVPYSPITDPNSGDGFLDQLVHRLLIYGDLKEAGRPETVSLDEAVRCLKDGSLDIVLGMMATVDRSKHVKFFPTPINLPVNAVYLDTHLEEILVVLHKNFPQKTLTKDDLKRIIKDALAKPKGRIDPFRLHPIFRPYEIGGLYCRLTLEISENNPEERALAPNYSEEDYLHTIHSIKASPARIPIIVADELMCLKVAQRSSDAQLLFPLGTQVDLPSYSVGFAVARQNQEWISYLEDVLPIYLRADMAFLKKQYDNLKLKLVDNALRAKYDQEAASSWAERVLGQTHSDLSTYYSLEWKTIKALPGKAAD